MCIRDRNTDEVAAVLCGNKGFAFALCKAGLYQLFNDTGAGCGLSLIHIFSEDLATLDGFRDNDAGNALVVCLFRVKAEGVVIPRPLNKDLIFVETDVYKRQESSKGMRNARISRRFCRKESGTR